MCVCVYVCLSCGHRELVALVCCWHAAAGIAKTVVVHWIGSAAQGTFVRGKTLCVEEAAATGYLIVSYHMPQDGSSCRTATAVSCVPWRRRHKLPFFSLHFGFNLLSYLSTLTMVPSLKLSVACVSFCHNCSDWKLIQLFQIRWNCFNFVSISSNAVLKFLPCCKGQKKATARTPAGGARARTAAGPSAGAAAAAGSTAADHWARSWTKRKKRI